MYEGQYEIKIECREIPVSAVCQKAAGNYNMMIVNTDTTAGVIITINDKEFGVARYGFRLTQIKDRGALTWGDSTGVHSKPAQFELTVNDDGTLLMWLRSTDSTQDFRVTGRRVRTPGVFYLDGGPDEQLAPYELIGAYKDYRHGAVLNVRQPLGADFESYDNYIASWFHTSGASIHFTSGNYRPEPGVLNLLSYSGTGYDMLKWALALRGGRWTGVGYSTITGRSFALALHGKE